MGDTCWTPQGVLNTNFHPLPREDRLTGGHNIVVPFELGLSAGIHKKKLIAHQHSLTR